MKLSTIAKIAAGVYAAANVAYIGAMAYTDAKKDEGYENIKNDAEYIISEDCAPGYKCSMLKSNFGFEAAGKAFVSNPGFAGLCNGITKKIFVFSNGARRLAKEMKCSYEDAVKFSCYHESRHSWQFHELQKIGIDAMTAMKFENKYKYGKGPLESDANAYADAELKGVEYNLTPAQFAQTFKKMMEAA